VHVKKQKHNPLSLKKMKNAIQSVQADKAILRKIVSAIVLKDIKVLIVLTEIVRPEIVARAKSIPIIVYAIVPD